MLDTYFKKLQETSKKSTCNIKDCAICNLHTFIHPDWARFLDNETEKPYFENIKKVLHHAPAFYPPVDKIFNFSHFTQFKDIKVVILGQDPYHNPGQAMGLSFSVPKSVRIPPSLSNIFQELENDIEGFVAPSHGDLSGWAKQGVLLLNDTLTVTKNHPASHASIGWKNFTRKIINAINDELENVVFMLWGNHARDKSSLINKKKHLVLEAGHPSPFSVKAFKGCRHFSIANEYLKRYSRDPIDWRDLS